MRALRIVPVFLIAGLLACDPNPPTDTATENTPLFNIANAPDVSGIVVREGFPFSPTWMDPLAGMRVVMGADPVEFCSGTIDFDVIPFQDAILADGRFVELGQGEEMRTSVWPFTAFDCGLFTTVAPLATGVANLVYTDNDLFGADPGDANTNAWGWMAHGTLTRPSGASAAFSGHLRFRFSQTSGFRLLSRQITLN